MVVPGTTALSSSDENGIYKMSSNPRGQVLIINNQNFGGWYKDREGAHVDSKNLMNLFKGLGFYVRSYRNLSKFGTFEAISNFSALFGQIEVDMAIVCILSHGEENDRFATADGMLIDFEHVMSKFNNDNCPQLKGKPKLFIFQACRGQRVDNGTIVSCKGDEIDGGVTRCREPSSFQKGLTWEDMIIAHSTLPGFVSHRDKAKGTWYIQSICEVFEKQAKDTRLIDMLIEVSRTMRRFEDAGEKQSCTFNVTHFYNKLFFNPPLRSKKQAVADIKTQIDLNKFLISRGWRISVSENECGISVRFTGPVQISKSLARRLAGK